MRALVLICLAACGFEHGALSGNKDASPDVPADIAITWSVDAMSGKAVPTNSMEWTDFIAAKGLAIPVPDSVWLMDESSGALRDNVGTVDLASIGSEPGRYRVSVNGWSRPGIGASDGSGVAFANTADAALPTISTSSMTVLLLYEIATPPGGSRTVMIAGCCGGYVDVDLNGGRYAVSANGMQMVGTMNHIGNVIPVILRLDHTASRQVVIADKEMVAVQNGTLGNYKGLFLGAGNFAAADGRWLYMTAWYGPSAEISDAKLQALVTALGW